MLSEKIKNKYEIILGFVTLVISLSAFKSNLDGVELDLGYAIISLGDYFLVTVYGFSFCLYLYICENIAKDTKIGVWKIFDYIIYLAYFIFAFILILPLIVFFNISCVWIAKKLSVSSDFNFNFKTETLETYKYTLLIVAGVLATVLSSSLLRISRVKKNEELEIEEIRDLDNARKMLADGYYSQSILETFKVLESYLYKNLLLNNIRARRFNIPELIKKAHDSGIIKIEDLSKINKIREARNLIAHTSVEASEDLAKEAINLVLDLFANQNKQNT